MSSHCLQAGRLQGRRSNFVWPSREQQQQLLQAQLAAAAVQQETQQRLQRARKALVNTARPRISSFSHSKSWTFTSATPRDSYTAAAKVVATAPHPTAALAAAVAAPWLPHSNTA